MSSHLYLWYWRKSSMLVCLTFWIESHVSLWSCLRWHFLWTGSINKLNWIEIHMAHNLSSRANSLISEALSMYYVCHSVVLELPGQDSHYYLSQTLNMALKCFIDSVAPPPEFHAQLDRPQDTNLNLCFIFNALWEEGQTSIFFFFFLLSS